LSILLLAAWRTLFGTSLAALRFLPALCGALTVFMTGLTAAGMGAGRLGQGLAALAYMAAAVPMVVFGFYSMNALQLPIWALLLYLLVRLGDDGSPRLWIAFGVVAGLGLLNKHTLVLLAVGLGVGLVLTPARRLLGEKRLWLGAAIAVALLLPNLVWQWLNDWPSLEFYRNAAMFKNLPASPLEVLTAQLLFMNPIGSLVWLAGLGFLLFSKRAKRGRFLGWLFLTLLVLMMVSGQSRPDRITGVYPVLLAAGGVFWESLSAKGARVWIARALMLLLALGGLALAPLGLPVLSPERATAYGQALGIVPQMERGDGKKPELPQWFADRFGWEELVRDVAGVRDEIPQTERENMLILAPSYGHAGALELFGPEYGLPAVAGTQNTYHLWGLPAGPIETVISIGYGSRTLSPYFAEVEQVAVHDCEHCMGWRDGMAIFVARKPTADFHDAWPEFRYYE
ncbi:MAG: hypothetical protein GTN89_14480, partial [Acidobacteria bacterium]|nr:hypothetical protein [Acidobacteriota bacterium]NIM60951.1 hypothetical protein [Acidobacteriota bacterium]NIO60441.1 hypothetical protein [Acidobacteriota bacterium]NIQ31539.1 hypothetical protein [Acidobacteriota bacterium]NIQ86791.1 hypothetical protein [Acidobacteriota bacterium]